MNKKLIYIVLILLASLFVLFLGYNSVKKYEVSLRYPESINSQKPLVRIYEASDSHADHGSHEGEDPILEFSSLESIKLRPGTYSAAIVDSKYKSNEIIFKVPNEKEITFSFELTDTELSKKLETESAPAHQVIRASINIPTNFSIASGNLFGEGQWYATVITENTPDDAEFYSEPDKFRVILQKGQTGTWALKTKTPKLLLNKHELPDVPQNIIDNANNIY